ncbi:hypothetical protein AWB80_08284 [Caballeronia pedi]|uniref:C2H2-type domain-containing protein n=1 Tax=Caballeronia pedi TaxID=1777141 RepID=A0A158E5I7_9BURK|nr:hypothetical protein AWB80_08284 [Caballeronia pedi]
MNGREKALLLRYASVPAEAFSAAGRSAGSRGASPTKRLLAWSCLHCWKASPQQNSEHIQAHERMHRSDQPSISTAI